MAGQERVKRTTNERSEEEVNDVPTVKEVGHTAVEGTAREDTEAVLADIDDLLNGIEEDGFLETDAQQFVDEFVQVGGE